jgi:hypothetical protein
VRCDLGEPDDRLHRLDLTEERPEVAEAVVAPMLKEASDLGCYVPVIWVRKVAPLFNKRTYLVDD